MLIARTILAALIGTGLLAASNQAFASNCSALLAPHSVSKGHTPFSMGFTTKDGRFTSWAGGGQTELTTTLPGDGNTWLSGTQQMLFSDRLGDWECDSSGLCRNAQPFDHHQPGTFTVWILPSDARLWLWNGSQWEGPFTPINDCDTGMLYYAGTVYGYTGMFQIGLGDTSVM